MNLIESWIASISPERRRKLLAHDKEVAKEDVHIFEAADQIARESRARKNGIVLPNGDVRVGVSN